MFGSLLKSVVNVTTDFVKVAVAPVVVAATVVEAATKPIAEAAEEVVKDIRDELND